MLIVVEVIAFLLCGFAGFKVCEATHQQRGIGVDPLSYLKIPDDPGGIALLDPSDPGQLHTTREKAGRN